MVWGASWVFLGVPPWNSQEALSGGNYSFWKWPDGEIRVKRGEKSFNFFAPKISNMCPVLMKNWRARKIEFIMPKNSQKVALSAFFSENGSFFCLFCIICIKIVANNFLWQLRGVCWYWWWDTCIEGWLALVLLRKSWRKREMAKTLPRVRKS